MRGSEPAAPGHAVAVGLDLGQSTDYAALAAVERIEASGQEPEYYVRGLKRYELGTAYPAIARDVEERLQLPQLSRSALVMDALGCGAPVVDMFRERGLGPVPVKVHGGAQETVDEAGIYSIPKRNLVSALLVAFQTNRIHIAARAPFVPEIRQELVAYRVKYSQGGHDSYEAWRESDHDDLVFALGLAVWWLRRMWRGSVKLVPRRELAGMGSRERGAAW